MVLSKRNLTKKKNNKYKSKTKSKSKYNKKNVSRKTMRGGAAAAPAPLNNLMVKKPSLLLEKMPKKLTDLLSNPQYLISDFLAACEAENYLNKDNLLEENNDLRLIIKMIKIWHTFLLSREEAPQMLKDIGFDPKTIIVVEYLYLILIIFLLNKYGNGKEKDILDKLKAQQDENTINKQITRTHIVHIFNILVSFDTENLDKYYGYTKDRQFSILGARYTLNKYIRTNHMLFINYINNNILPILKINKTIITDYIEYISNYPYRNSPEDMRDYKNKYMKNIINKFYRGEYNIENKIFKPLEDLSTTTNTLPGNESSYMEHKPLPLQE